MTIGLEFHVKTKNFKNKKINFIFWDLAGCGNFKVSRFRFVHSDLCRGADVAIIKFDLLDYEPKDLSKNEIEVVRENHFSRLILENFHIFLKFLLKTFLVKNCTCSDDWYNYIETLFP